MMPAMPKSRNLLRLERRRAESAKPGTVQYAQAHRSPLSRRLLLRALARANRALGPRRFERVGGSPR